MGADTAISWTDHTFNPWIGCQRVSPGCQHCYAETLNHRWGNDNWGANADRRVTSDANWRLPLKWNREAEAAGRRDLVFCASMADVFEMRADLMGARARLWALVDQTPHLTWQLLTKRPENVCWMVPGSWLKAWPSNVWIGCTAEDQQRADERIPHLLEVPAQVRFLSCEPLLGPVDLAPWIDRVEVRDGWGKVLRVDYPSQIAWVIVGGESGPGHRPLDLAHARDIHGMCRLARVPFFFKQVGGQHPTSGGDRLDGVIYKEFPAGHWPSSSDMKEGE
jgi:protein gp37